MTEENTQDIAEEANAEAPAPEQEAAPQQEAAPAQDPSVYKRQIQAGPEANVDPNEVLELDVNVSVWEVQTEESIAGRFARLETQELQVRGTMEKLEANGAKEGDDYANLQQQHNEIVRAMEHIRKTLNAGDVVLLGKVKGSSKVKIGSDWNQCLDRHVIVDRGKVVRILWRSPI